jgi:hypothetical protein
MRFQKPFQGLDFLEVLRLISEDANLSIYHEREQDYLNAAFTKVRRQNIICV